jgi:hypothetical protein
MRRYFITVTIRCTRSIALPVSLVWCGYTKELQIGLLCLSLHIGFAQEKPWSMEEEEDLEF